MQHYRIIDEEIRTFFSLAEGENLVLPCYPPSFFDGENIKSPSSSSLYSNGSFKPGKSIFLQIPYNQFPLISKAYKEELESYRKRLLSDAMDFIWNVLISHNIPPEDMHADFQTWNDAHIMSHFRSLFQSYYHTTISTFSREATPVIIDTFIDCYLERLAYTLNDIFSVFVRRTKTYIQMISSYVELNIRTSTAYTTELFGNSVSSVRHSSMYAVLHYKGTFYLRLSPKQVGQKIVLFQDFRQPFATISFKEE